MKLFDKSVSSPTETIVFPRGKDELVFKAKPIADYESFNTICPEPIPPEVIPRGGAAYRDVNDKEYLAARATWSERKMAWMMINSLSATEGLTWDTVITSDPNTWTNYSKELESSGLSQLEQSLLVELVFTACGMNQNKIEAATKSFLAQKEIVKP